MVISRKARARDYKDKKPLTAFGRLILPLTLVMALALLYLSVKLFFFAPEKFVMEQPPLDIHKDEFLVLPGDKRPPAGGFTDDMEDEVTITPQKEPQKEPPKRVVQPQVVVKKPAAPVKTKRDDPPGGNAAASVRTKPAVKTEGGVRWDIQIGGFSAKEGAELTVRQAKEAGYAVYIVDAVLNGKPFYKVRVKGEADKKASAALSKRLEKAGFPVYLVEIKR